MRVHFSLLHPANQHAALEHAAQLRQRHAFLFQRRLKCLLALDLVVFLDRIQHVVELLVGDDLHVLNDVLGIMQVGVRRVDA